MALTTVATSVAGSAVALHSAGPTTVKLKNYGNGIVLVGPTGAGNQRFPLHAGQTETFTIGGSEVLFGITGDGSTNTVVAIHP